MSKFTEMLTVSPLPDGRTWIIRKKFGYGIGTENSNTYIDVPIGFMTDFASVPRLLWAIIPQWGTYGNAAVIHDYCYCHQHITIKKNRQITEKGITRKRADEIFFEAMGVLKVPFYYRYPMYWAVRAFGWHRWRFNENNRSKGDCRIAKIVKGKLISRSS